MRVGNTRQSNGRLKNARPLCDGCGRLLLGIFFTCVKCFDDDTGEAEAFNLCTDCFRHGKYVHPHDQFLDNYVLLEAKRRELREERHKFQLPATDANTATTLAIVPANPGHAISGRVCLAAMDVAVGLATRFCTIMGERLENEEGSKACWSI